MYLPKNICLGSISIKTIKDKQYMYYIYYANDAKYEKYCGLASSDESKRKAIEFELEELEGQQKSIALKISELSSKLNK